MASRQRKLKSLELFSLAIVIGLIVGVDLYIFGINKRLSALENEFVEVKAWAFPASLLEGKYASLNARVRALTDAFSGLDTKLASLASQQRQVAAAAEPAGDEVMATADAAIPSEAPAAGIAGPAAGNAAEPAESTGVVTRSDEQAPAAASAPVDSPPVAADGGPAVNASPAVTSAVENPLVEPEEVPAIPATTDTVTDTVPAQAKGKEGPWVINLLSDPNAAAAERFAARARDHGIAVQQNEAEVKGRTFFRVQLTGFATAKEAQVRAAEVKEKLNLKEVWIFKQQG